MDAADKLKPKAGLFDEIIPPRLEDAGLEDCALPPDSIREAFSRAASAVKSRAASILSSDRISPDRDPPENGAKLPEFGADAVVVVGSETGEEAKEKSERPVLGEGFA